MQWLSRVWTFGLALLAIVFGVAIALSNRDAIPVSIPMFFNQTVPASVAFALFFVLGAAFGGVWFGGDHVRKTLTIRRLRRRLREIEGDAPGRAGRPRREHDEPQLDDALSTHS
jgi:uncharacterized membrane protein YciS (DUF1049 family)